MPPKTKISKENIIKASMNIIRAGGVSKLNARAVAKDLKCSTQPIFSVYAVMEDLKDDVIKTVGEYYARFFDDYIKNSKMPPYKASGRAYIQFAKDEREYFKLLFMRDRTGAQTRESEHSFEAAIKMIMEATGLDNKTATLFHLQMWIFTHGLATLIVTSFLDLSDDLTDILMKNAFLGALAVYKEKGAE